MDGQAVFSFPGVKADLAELDCTFPPERQPVIVTSCRA